MNRRCAFVVGVALAVVALSACTNEAATLKALQSDPMAYVELPGALESRHSESAGNEGIPIPAPAEIRNTFTVPRGSVREGMETLADAAREVGWVVEVNEYGGYSGQKTMDGRFIQLSIDGNDADDVLWIIIFTNDF